MNPIRLFTKFSGRIGRRSFWLGIILLAVFSPFSLRTILSANPLQDAILAVRDLGIAGLVWTLVLLVGVAALMTKRLHDRNRSGVYAAIFYLPAAIAAAIYFAGQLPLLDDLARWSTWIAGFAGTAGLWFLIQLGFFPGTKGANSYGPDPRG